MFEAGSIIWRLQTAGAQVFISEMKQVDRAVSAAGKSTKAAGEEQEKAGRKAEEAAPKQAKLKKELSETATAGDKAAKSTKDAAKATDEAGKKSQESAPKIKSVRQELASLSDEGKRAAREVGTSMAAIGAGVLALSALTVKAAIDWETAWTGVTKTVDGTPAQLAEVEAGLRDLTGVLPASHQEIAAVAEAAGQLGVRADDVVRFTKVMIDLGETTNLTSDEAATSLAQLMNIFQTAPQDVDRLGAAVVALGNDGASTERDIVQMGQRIAGAAKIIGLTEGETLGLANALASVGIEAEAGGSAVSNIMIDISKAVSKGGKDLEAWADVAGMSADEFAARWKKDPAEALATIVEGMGQLNASGGDVFAMLEQLGQSDVRVTRALLNLANSGDLLRDSLELGNEAWAENSALQEEAEKRYATTAAKLDMARNSVVDMAIELGEHLLPIVTAAADGVKGFTDFIGSLPDDAQAAISVVGALGAGILILGGLFLVLLPRLLEFRTSMKTLSAEMPRTTGAVRGFAIGLGAALFVLTAFAIAQAETKANTDALADTLDDASGAVTGYTRELVAKRLEEAGAFDSAKKAGVSQKELTDAVIQGGDALTTMMQRLQDATSGADKLGQSFDGTNVGILGARLTIEDLAGELDNARESWQNTASATDGATNSTVSAAAAYTDAQAEVAGLTRELDSLLALLDEANGTNRDAITSNLDYRDALADVDETIRQAREGVEGYQLTLDQSTQAGRDNMGMLVDLASNAWDAAEAQLALDGNAAAFQQRLEDSRAELMQRAQDLGYTAEQAQDLADKILGIPDRKEIEILAETAAASQVIDGFLTRYDGSTVRVIVDAVGGTTYDLGGNGRLFEADGGHVTHSGGGSMVQHFANGGEHHVAQFARAGTMRVWAEPETGGEWYLPDSPAKRPRSERIAQKMLAGWGYDMVPQGAGGDVNVSVSQTIQTVPGMSMWDAQEAAAYAINEALRSAGS